MSGLIRIVVADDHPLFREGVVTSLTSRSAIAIVGQAENADEAVRLVREERPDLALLDITITIVMLTVSENEDDLLEGMKVVASGYVLKGVSARELAAVLRSVSPGEVYVAPSLAFGLLREMSRLRPSDPMGELSARERQVLELVASWFEQPGDRAQARAGGKTIKHYMTNILAKLQVRSRVESALLATKVGLGQSGGRSAR